MISVSIRIKGKVQGVFFRKFTQQAAIKYAISGYVKNLPDGDVQVEATGNESDMNKFIEWCHTGSPLSKVEEVIVTDLPQIKYSGFTIRY